MSLRSLLTMLRAPAPTSTILLIYLLNGLAMRIEVLLPQYTSLLLAWPLATVNGAMALKALISALVLFILPSLRQKYLEPRMRTQQIDLFITQASLVANMLGGDWARDISAGGIFHNLIMCVYERHWAGRLADDVWNGDAACRGECIGILYADRADQHDCCVIRGAYVVRAVQCGIKEWMAASWAAVLALRGVVWGWYLGSNGIEALTTSRIFQGLERGQPAKN